MRGGTRSGEDVSTKLNRAEVTEVGVGDPIDSAVDSFGEHNVIAWAQGRENGVDGCLPR